MTRPEFLKKLLGSFVVGTLPLELTKQFRKIYLLQCFIAGFRYYDGMKLLNEMKEGDLLELVREPANEYDNCAIALHWRDKKLGFIPADTNEMLSFLLDAQALSLFAVVTHIEPNVEPWENVAVAVYFIQEANKDLPAHASYLTRIEAPHYRTLQTKEKQQRKNVSIGYERLFETTDRVINLETIPAHHLEAKDYFEKWYSNNPVAIQGGKFVQVKNDGIFTYMYDIDEKVKEVKDAGGNIYLEFSLV